MDDHRRNDHAEQDSTDLLADNSFGEMLDFDYSTLLDKDYSKDLEQKLFVDHSEMDLLSKAGDTAGISNTYEYLNTDSFSESSASGYSDSKWMQEMTDPEKPVSRDTGVLSQEWETGSILPESASTSKTDYRQEMMDSSSHPLYSSEEAGQISAGALQDTVKETDGKAGKERFNKIAVAAVVLICAIIWSQTISPSRHENRGEYLDHEDTEDQDDESFWDLMTTTLAGDDYVDFYTPRCIASSTFDPNEFCVIDAESLIGTIDSPIISEKELNMVLDETSHYLYFDPDSPDDSEVFYGYYLSYVWPDESFEKYIDGRDLEMPQMSDPDRFFENVRDGYEQISGSDPSAVFRNLECGNIESVDVQGHHLKYMELTYTDKGGTDYRDVFSFEERPEEYAFLAECRFPKTESANGEEALSSLYAMLSFYEKDELKDVPFARQRWDESRIYNQDNSHAVLINLSDYMNVTSAYQYTNDEVRFYNGKTLKELSWDNDEEQPSEEPISVNLKYNGNCSEPGEIGFEEYIEGALQEEEEDLLHYQVDVQEYKRKEFEFSGSDIYFCSYLFSDFASSLNRADESSGTPRQGRFHYLIRTPEQDEYILEITRSADSLKGFDPEGFLQKCVTIE